MTRRLTRIALAAWLGIAAGGLPQPASLAAEPQAPEAAPPAGVPQGEPQQISDWALAGVLWSDAHLVRRLADAASRHPDAGSQASSLQSVAAQSEQLINSLESLGWKRIAQAEASPAPTAAAAAPDPGVPDLRPALAGRPAVAPRPDPPQVPDPTAPSATVPTERNPRLQERLEVNAARGANSPGISTQLGGTGTPINIERMRVGDYIDDTPLETLNRADALADGVEGALAAGADNISTPPELFGPDIDLVPPPRYDDPTINRGVVEDPDAGEIEVLAPEPEPRAAPPEPAVATSLPIDRYTDRSDQYAQDAPWVQFRVDANQQRWRMLTADAEQMPLSRMIEQLRAALMQLRADAAVARRAAGNSELAEILAGFGGN